MGPAFYVLAILGCGEGETQCQQVATAPASYQSQADCNAASEDLLARHTDADFPVVVAQCRRADGPAAAQVWADEVKLPQGDNIGARVQQAKYEPRRKRS
jgi:hypothetical protein